MRHPRVPTTTHYSWMMMLLLLYLSRISNEKGLLIIFFGMIIVIVVLHNEFVSLHGTNTISTMSQFNYILQQYTNNNSNSNMYMYSSQVKIPPISSQTSSSTTTTTTTTTKTTPEYYVVFSTSCSLQQDWESYVFFYHCQRIQQPGNITRIISGCNNYEEQQKQMTFYNTYIRPMANTTIQSFHIHFTPDYSRLHLSENKFPYKYMNKPYGLRHWMEHVLQLNWTTSTDDDDDDNNNNIIDYRYNRTMTSPYLNNTNDPKQQLLHENLINSIIILMDPDMILLRPITHDFSNNNNVIVVPHEKNNNLKHQSIQNPLIVQHGNPISQQDGYLSNEWMYMNWTYISNNPDIIPPKLKNSHGPMYYNTGPPYLATVYDMYHIVSLWTETAPRVLHVYPQLFAEMYGFVIATVLLQLPFTMIKSIVVSTTTATDREGWYYIDQLPDSDICHVPVRATSSSSIVGQQKSSTNQKIDDIPILPTALHYCGIYLLRKSMFSKYRVKKNILNCDKGLMKLPSIDDWYPKHNYKIYPPRADKKDIDTYKEVQKAIPQKQAKREAFMICGMINALNEALRYYKQQACGRNGLPIANMNETYTIHDDPTDY